MAVVNLPDSPANGTTQTVGGITYTYNSSKGYWTAAASGGGGGGGASVSTSDAAPSSPSDGDLWYDTDDGGMFVYYEDADSSQWVEVIGSAGSDGAAGAAASASYANFAAFPGSPTEGDIAYAQDTNTLYLYNGTSWEVVASGNDESPVILTEPPTSTQSLTGGATSTVTMVAQDPEGFDIQYGIAYKTTGNARPDQLGADTTINQSTGVFTLTASSNSSHAGSFKARLSASDGARTTTRFVDFSLSFYDFTISPAVSGQSTWTLASGALTLDTAQVYTITPLNNMNINAKMWGAGGSTTGNYAGGAGGYASGTVALTGGTSYKIRIGSETGGGTGGSGSGGGYSGIFVTSETHANSVIIAGGGGGGCSRYSVDQQPGAGGGAAGQTGGWVGGPGGGGGGTQSAGGAGSAAGTNRAGTDGSALTGGVGNSAGSYGGGGGGSGYYGGGGGAARVGGDGGNNGMGGGGSGYIGHSSVSSGVNTAGNLGTPGNSSDSARGTAGNPAVAGKVVISASSQE